MLDLAINTERKQITQPSTGDSYTVYENDLAINNYDLSFVSGLESVAQLLRIRLQFFYSEWYLDTTKGVKYYDDIFIKNPTLSKIQSIIKSVISDTPDVTEILSLDCSLTSDKRGLDINFTVDTTYGQLTNSTGVQLP